MSLYQIQPDEGFTPEELAQSEVPTIYASIAVVTFIATIGVVLRFVSRARSKSTIGYDDYTIALALIFLVGVNITVILDAALYGLGRHLPAIDPNVLPSFQKIGLANFVLYFTTSALIKASLLLLYYRYFGISKRFRWALYTCGAIIACWYIAVTFSTIFQCTPVSAFWDRTIQHAKCVDLVQFSIGSGITNLLTDVMILCLPMPMVWSLHMNRAQKWTLTGIFFLGFFVCAVSIIRISLLAKVKYLDVTWQLEDVFIWTSVEPSIGILSACLPTLRKKSLNERNRFSIKSEADATTGPLFGGFFNLSSRIAPTSKTGSATKKSVVTESTLSPASPRHDWGFSRLDEEAATEDRGPMTWDGNVRPWENNHRTGRDAYEMGGFEKEPLPTSPTRTHKAPSVGRQKW